MKTTTLWALVAGCSLAAFQSWAGSIPIGNIGIMTDDEDYATVDALGPFGQSDEWIDPNDSFDNISSYRASLMGLPSLDMGGGHQTSAMATIMGLPQNGKVAPERELAGRSDSGPSFILIGLGGSVLICLRWRMAHSPQSAPVKAR